MVWLKSKASSSQLIHVYAVWENNLTKPLNYHIIIPACTKYCYKMCVDQNSLGNLWSRQLPSGVPFGASVSQFLETYLQRPTNFLIAFFSPFQAYNWFKWPLFYLRRNCMYYYNYYRGWHKFDTRRVSHFSGRFTQQLLSACWQAVIVT